MKNGQVVDGRWRIIAEADGDSAVVRYRATDTRSGTPADIIAPRRGAEVSASMAKLHAALSGSRDSATVEAIALVSSPSGPMSVRQRLEDATLDDLRGPMAPGIVAAIGAHLFPAVVELDWTGSGLMRPRDVGLDETGHPVLSPRPVALPLDTDTLPWVAPEVSRGGAVQESPLYSLGVLLYRLATGSLPRHRAALPGELPGPPPAPSTLRPEVPPELDRAILGLLGSDPTLRDAALPLLQDAAQALPDLRFLVSRKRSGSPVRAASMPPGQVRYTTTGSSGAGEVRYTVAGTSGGSPRVFESAPRSGVVIPAAELAALDANRLAEAAGVAGVPASAIDQLVRDGLPLLVEGHHRPRGAERRRSVLDSETSLPLAVHRPPGLAGAAVGGLSLVVAAVALLGTFVSFLALGIPTTLVFALVALASTAVGVLFLALYAARWRQYSTGLAGAWAVVADAQRLTQREDAIGATWRRVSDLYTALARADIPAAPASDLRSGLRDVERRLEHIAGVDDQSSRAIQGVDLAALQERLDGLNRRPELSSTERQERDQLARTVRDLVEIGARREALGSELQRLDDALDEVAVVLGRLGDSESPSGLEQLARSTRLARELVSTGGEALPRPDREPAR